MVEIYEARPPIFAGNTAKRKDGMDKGQDTDICKRRRMKEGIWPWSRI